MEEEKVYLNLGKDLPDMKPSIALPLTWVGLENLESDVFLTPLFVSDPDPIRMLCKFDLYSNLSEHKRGIHLSRLCEAFFKMRNLAPRGIFQFCEELAQEIRRTQNQGYGRVRLHCKHIVERKTAVTSKPTLFPLHLGVDVAVSALNTTYSSSIAVKLMTVCPCGLEMSKASKESRSTKSTNTNSTFGFSHTQRAALELAVTSKKPIEHRCLLEITEGITPFVSVTLKRPDEFDFIQRAYKNSMFCEDIIRKVLKEARQYLYSLDLHESKLKVSIRSEESIHPFSIVAHADLEEDRM